MRALLVVPGLMGCALVVGGLTSGNDLMAGVGFGLAGSALVAFFALKISDASAVAAERRRIWKTGRPATARVIALSEVGRGEDHPEADLELEVRVDGAPPATVKVRSLISRLAVPRIQPGCDIQVRLDPAGGSKVVIDPALTPYPRD
ncbi:MAG: hypothetical protein EHM91_12340 [Planctomycetota bacterium]|nr:MAG: hypothetical protein EHM91_12340 [Planctomycetota bacterium]